VPWKALDAFRADKGKDAISHDAAIADKSFLEFLPCHAFDWITIDRLKDP
jgi:hypothetical protein